MSIPMEEGGRPREIHKLSYRKRDWNCHHVLAARTTISLNTLYLLQI